MEEMVEEGKDLEGEEATEADEAMKVASAAEAATATCASVSDEVGRGCHKEPASGGTPAPT